VFQIFAPLFFLRITIPLFYSRALHVVVAMVVVVRLGESFRCSTYHKYAHRSFDISDHPLTAPNHTRSNERYGLWDTPIRLGWPWGMRNQKSMRCCKRMVFKTTSAGKTKRKRARIRYSILKRETKHKKKNKVEKARKKRRQNAHQLQPCP